MSDILIWFLTYSDLPADLIQRIFQAKAWGFCGWGGGGGGGWGGGGGGGVFLGGFLFVGGVWGWEGWGAVRGEGGFEIAVRSQPFALANSSRE